AKFSVVFDGFDGGRRGRGDGRRLTKGNLACAALQRQIGARRLIVRHLAHELTPYYRRTDDLSLLGIDHTERVSRIRLAGIQPQRIQRLALGIREHSAPLIDKGEIEVRLGMVLTEEPRPLQTVRSFVQVAVFELS